MAKLSLISDIRDMTEYRSAVWDRAIGEGSPEHVAPYKYPLLVKAVPTKRSLGQFGSLSLFMVMCTKSEAKRIVYPKTNRNRSHVAFTVIEGGLMGAMNKYMIDTVDSINQHSPKVDTYHPIQRAMLNKAISELDGANGSALVTSRVYTNLNGLRLVDFYVVTNKDARTLVYWNKGPSAKLRAISPELSSAAINRLIKSRQKIHIER